MNARELMIGDWVDDTTLHPESKVLGIEDGQVLVKRKSDRWFYRTHESNIKPIPLTEKILRKNGWVDESGGYEHYLSIDKEHDVEIHCDGDAITWMINLGEYDIMRLEYVHQLQHVLRLFNIEEEVVL